jgi:UDP-GlcNAc:undecaprenyl-phosphate GlcNAc-1-phosphate transferase
MLFYLLAFVVIAAFVSYPLTNYIGLLARRWGFVDRPDGHHKGHSREVALGGGLAVFLAAATTFAVEYLSSSPLQKILADEAPYLGGLLLAGAWIVGVGLYDDRFGLRGRYKLLGQVIAALIVIRAGLVIESFVVFEERIHLGPFSTAFTIFWLLGAMNSLNLLDGIDGLASTIGIILTATITVIAMVAGQDAVAVVGAVFTGSLLGFLRFNFPPAKIFLGDAGSMLIGLVVGTLAIGGSMKGPATVAMAAPLAIWALPIFDSIAAILRRKLTGRSIYATDRGHLHHRLLVVFGKNTRVLAVVAICCAVTCAGALFSTFFKNDLMAIIAVISVLCMLVATQAFGHVEFLILFSRLKSLFSLLIHGDGPREYSIRLQGSRDWNIMWQSITEFAEKLNLVEVKLDLNLVAMQEGFHATWRRPSTCEKRDRWSADIPLFAEEHLIGRLWVSGNRPVELTSCETIHQLMDLLEPLEAEIVALATNHPAEDTPPVPAETLPSSPSSSRVPVT